MSYNTNTFDPKESKQVNNLVSPDLHTFDNTFIVSRGQDQIVLTHMYDILEQRYNLKEVPITNFKARPLFVWAYFGEKMQYDKRLYRIHCAVKNVLTNDKDIICRKDLLAIHMQTKGFAQDIADTHVCDVNVDPMKVYTILEKKFGTLSARDILIFRPAECSSGVGITTLVHPTPTTVARAIEYGRDEAVKLKHHISPVLVSRYVGDLALWYGRKFHLRAYFLVSVIRGRVRTHLWSRGDILAAAKPFVLDHFYDKDIHDTHFDSTGGDYAFPKDLVGEHGVSAEVYDIAWKSMSDTLTHVSEILAPHAKVFNESKYGFEIFGVDFLIRSNGSTVLLEVNDKVGYSMLTKSFSEEFGYDYYEWIDQCVLAPLFRNSNPPTPLYETESHK